MEKQDSIVDSKTTDFDRDETAVTKGPGQSSLMEQASTMVVYASIVTFACMFFNPPVVDPELFQNDYELLKAIKNSPYFIISHLLQFAASVAIFCGILTFSLIILGVVKVEQWQGKATAREQLLAVLFIGVGVVGSNVVSNFLIVDGFGLMEVALRWFSQDMTATEVVTNSSEVMAIDNGYVATMMIFWVGLTPFLFAILLKSVHPPLALAANTTMVFSTLSFLAGIGYSIIFFTEFITLSEGNEDMTPYYQVTSFMFACSGLTILAVGNVARLMGKAAREARLTGIPIRGR